MVAFIKKSVPSDLFGSSHHSLLALKDIPEKSGTYKVHENDGVRDSTMKYQASGYDLFDIKTCHI